MRILFLNELSDPRIGSSIRQMYQHAECLRARGHEVEVAPEWTVGRMVAVSNAGDGILRAAATPRLMQAYAVGR